MAIQLPPRIEAWNRIRCCITLCRAALLLEKNKRVEWLSSGMSRWCWGSTPCSSSKLAQIPGNGLYFVKGTPCYFYLVRYASGSGLTDDGESSLKKKFINVLILYINNSLIIRISEFKNFSNFIFSDLPIAEKMEEISDSNISKIFKK